MRLNSKGQITIPAALRAKYDLREGDEIDIVDDGRTLCIVKGDQVTIPGRRLVDRMRGRATTKHSTDELMDLLRGE
jgi:AbrB family looped-hinge helix DNA binding protein